MSRHRSYGALDNAPLADEAGSMDAVFLGVNMRLAPDKLPPGVGASARNKRFENGQAECRKGIAKLPWSNRGNSFEFTANAATDQLTTTGSHGMATKDPVVLMNSGGALPAGTDTSTIYYVRVISAKVVTLHTSEAGASANTGLVDVTGAGTGRHVMIGLKVLPYDRVWGVGVFKDPDEFEWVIVAADDKVYRFAECNQSSAIPLPDGVVIDYPVSFTQCFNVLIMFRGDSREPLVMDGVGAGFVPVSVKNVSSASEMMAPNTRAIPNADNGEAFGNRLLIPHSRDLVAVSDILDYTRYAPAEGAYRINQGSPDKLVRLIKFSETTIIALKEKSVYAIGNLIADVRGNFSNARLDPVTEQYGCKAAKSAIRIGNDVWFLADKRGVVSISKTENDKLLAVDIPVSQDIQPLIDRINWNYAANATAADFGNRSYLAVPLDDAEIIKANLIDTKTYGNDGTFTLTVKKGRRYRFTKGANETKLVNGDEVLTDNADFTAKGSSVILQTSTSFLRDNFDNENAQQFQENYTGFANWNVTAGAVDLIGPGYDIHPFPDENMYVDMIGTVTADDTYNGWSATEIESKSAFDFAAGTTYELVIKVAGSKRGGTNDMLTVTIGALLSEEIHVASSADSTTYTYQFTPGSNASAKIKLNHSDADFLDCGMFLLEVNLYQVAAGAEANKAVTASVQPVFVGVNNAVLVYDRVNRLWAGYDDGQNTPPAPTWGANEILGLFYDPSAYPNDYVDWNVTKGKRYAWTPGIYETQLDNGSETYTKATEFVALSTTVRIYFSPSNVTSTGSLTPQTGWTENYTGLVVQDWFKHTFAGEERLFFISPDGFVNLYEEGFYDEVADRNDNITAQQISDEFVSRGYKFGTEEQKRFEQVTIGLSTWDPKFSVTALMDGVKEEKALATNKTRSRTKYFKPFDKADYVATNTNDDFFTPHREDYSLAPAEDDTLNLDGAGVDPDLHQHIPETFRIGRQGTYCQIKIASAQGRTSVTSLKLEATDGPRRLGRKG